MLSSEDDRKDWIGKKRKLQAIDARYQALFDDATDTNARQAVMSVWDHETAPLKQEIAGAETAELQHRAAALGIDLHDHGKYWIVDKEGAYALTPDGVTWAHKRIRTARTKRDERRVVFWVPVLSLTVAIASLVVAYRAQSLPPSGPAVINCGRPSMEVARRAKMWDLFRIPPESVAH